MNPCHYCNHILISFTPKKEEKKNVLCFQKEVCQTSGLSQVDHSCLTLTDAHQLELYFEDVLFDVDESDIF